MSDEEIEQRLGVDRVRERVWMTIDCRHREHRPRACVRMLLQVIHEVGIGIQEVKSQAPALSLEELALAITQFVAHILWVKARLGLHIKHDKWNGALARRGSQPLESTHNAIGANHIPIFVWECRIFIQARGLTLCNGTISEVEHAEWLPFNGHDALINGVRQIEQIGPA